VKPLIQLLLIALLLAACGGGGTKPTPGPGRAGVSLNGQVVNDAGASVSGAAVQLSMLSATSDTDGSFSFSLQSAGYYSLSIQSPAGVFHAETVTVPDSGAEVLITLDPTPSRFALVGVHPMLNSENAPLRDPIVLTFSRSIDESMLSSATFALSPTAGELTISVNGSEVQLQPLYELQTSQRYRLEVSNVRALDGAQLASDAYNFFTTQSRDDQPPVLVRTAPAHGATNVPRNQSFEFTFSDEVQAPSGVLQAAFTPSVPIAQITVSENTVKVSPGGMLEASTEYALTLEPVSDAVGNLSESSSLSFTTGTAVMAFDDIEPHWNSFANAIVFARAAGGAYDLYLISPEGTNLERLTDTYAGERHPRFSSDGQLIVYQSNEDGNWDIFARSLESGLSSQLTFLPEDEVSPVFSGTFSQLIAYVRQESEPNDSRIFLMNADGSFNRAADESATRDEYEPVFHPLLDNQLLCVTYEGGDRDVFSKSAFLESDNPVNANLTSNLVGNEFQAVWAPDAQAIAFISDQSGVRNVWIMDPSGSAHYQITHFTDPVHSLAYSPIPGEERVVVSVGPGNSRSLYVVSLISGGIERRLTE